MYLCIHHDHLAAHSQLARILSACTCIHQKSIRVKLCMKSLLTLPHGPERAVDVSRYLPLFLLLLKKKKHTAWVYHSYGPQDVNMM